jgi:hypothetical protein
MPVHSKILNPTPGNAHGLDSNTMNRRFILSIVFVIAGLLAGTTLFYWLWQGEQEAKLPYSTGYDPTDKVQEKFRKTYKPSTNATVVPPQPEPEAEAESETNSAEVPAGRIPR